MRKNLFIIACLSLIVMLANGCKTGVYTTNSGKEDISYLQFVSSGSLSGKTVLVELDNGIVFKAKVDKQRKSYTKPNLYTIQPGKRTIMVKYRGEKVVERDVYVSQQSTKTIVL